MLSFVVTCLILEITPGPNMAYLAVLSASKGRSAGFATVAGIALGLAIIGVAAAIGLASIIANSVVLYQLLRWGGVLYLLWIAWQSWHEEADITDDGGLSGEAHAEYFRRGLFVNLLNPKAGVFYIAVLPRFVDPALPSLGQLITLSMVFVLIATGIHLLVVIFASSAERFFDDPKISQIVRRALAIVLACVAFWFAWSTRSG